MNRKELIKKLETLPPICSEIWVVADYAPCSVCEANGMITLKNKEYFCPECGGNGYSKEKKKLWKRKAEIASYQLFLGNALFSISFHSPPKEIKEEIGGIHIGIVYPIIMETGYEESTIYSVESIGKTLFLTEKEADAMLTRKS